MSCLFSVTLKIQEKIILRTSKRDSPKDADRKYDVSIEELASGSRRSQAAKARRAFSWICVRELGYSGADAARFLGVANSCVTRIISKGKTEDIDDIDLTK
jgi:hypothetical protein